MDITNTCRFEHIRRDRVTFINDLGGKFLMQVSQKLTAIFDNTNFIILIQQKIGETRPRATAPGNEYVHFASAFFGDRRAVSAVMPSNVELTTSRSPSCSFVVASGRNDRPALVK